MASIEVSAAETWPVTAEPSSRSFIASPEWWGPRWIGRFDPEHEHGGRYLTIVDLIESGTLDSGVAAFLWEVISRRSSIIVVAGPSGVGKTTLLTALADFLPVKERTVVVRGSFDPLGFLDDPAIDPDGTTALVNEMSPHLPIYLWGPGVVRLLTSPRRFRTFATAHASSAQDFVAQLAGYPLRVPLAGVARLNVVVRLNALPDGDAIRRTVTEVTVLDTSERDGIVLRPMMVTSSNSLDRSAVMAWFDEVPERGDELTMAVRHNVLTKLVAEPGASDRSDDGPRGVLAAAFARALSGT